MKIGVLGAGFMGGTHARAYAKLPDVQVVAVSSRSAEKAAQLAAKVGAQPVTEDRAILDDPTIDAVSIALPTHLHTPLAVAALQAGKHVLLEKPMALTVADCDAIIAAQTQSGKLLMVAHVLRFWPEYQALVQEAQSGKLGRPFSGVASRLTQRPAWTSWFTQPELSGGAVIDLMIHDLDTLNWLFGTPQSVYARGQLSGFGMWDHILATVDYGNAQAIVEASELLPPGYPFTCTLAVLCEAGRAEYTFRAGGVSVEMGVGVNALVAWTPDHTYQPASESGDAYERQIAYFVDCVRHGRAPEAGSPAQARLAVAVANAARRSLETGEVIPVA
jgi:predicted dehydrogenase